MKIDMTTSRKNRLIIRHEGRDVVETPADEFEFTECNTCGNRDPGTPLCSGCMLNLKTIRILQGMLRGYQSAKEKKETKPEPRLLTLQELPFDVVVRIGENAPFIVKVDEQKVASYAKMGARWTYEYGWFTIDDYLRLDADRWHEFTTDKPLPV